MKQKIEISGGTFAIGIWLFAIMWQLFRIKQALQIIAEHMK